MLPAGLPAEDGVGVTITSDLRFVGIRRSGGARADLAGEVAMADDKEGDEPQQVERTVIIGRTSSPTQNQQINHLAAAGVLSKDSPVARQGTRSTGLSHPRAGGTGVAGPQFVGHYRSLSSML